ncbi:MAG: hypothetical protein IH595_05605 [Bacteroidales bacterium]|nr:hypothetical protein [Bacteroidales bacterium]
MEDSKVFIITGEQGRGKTTFLKLLLPELERLDIKVIGFYADGQWKNDVRVRFDVVDIQSRKSHLLCSDEPNAEFERIGRYYFDPKTILWGEDLLLNEDRTGKCLFVIDEIGKFEIAQKVWHNVLRELLDIRMPILITVRKEILERVIEYFQIQDPIVFRLDSTQKKVAQAIAGQL